MPFDDEYKDLSKQPETKSGLNKVSSQKSIFEGQPRKQTQEQFDQRIKNIQEVASDHKQRMAQLAAQFLKLMADKTLPENKNIFAQDMEREVLINMINLAETIDNDENEPKIGSGTLGWVTILLKMCLAQRDRINQLEYALVTITKSPAFVDAINKEISKALDKKKPSE